MSSGIDRQLRETLDTIVSRYPHKRAALLPVLHAIQGAVGQIGTEEEKQAATLLDIEPLEVREVVTFYSMFLKRAVGRHHIQICANLSCSLLGAGRLIEFLEGKLGIKPGETSEDGRFSLSTVECLGACEQAPCMMVNFDYYGNLTEERIEKILDGLE